MPLPGPSCKLRLAKLKLQDGPSVGKKIGGSPPTIPRRDLQQKLTGVALCTVQNPPKLMGLVVAFMLAKTRTEYFLLHSYFNVKWPRKISIFKFSKDQQKWAIKLVISLVSESSAQLQLIQFISSLFLLRSFSDPL
jgi:hypothetical protein